MGETLGCEKKEAFGILVGLLRSALLSFGFVFAFDVRRVEFSFCFLLPFDS